MAPKPLPEHPSLSAPFTSAEAITLILGAPFLLLGLILGLAYDGLRVGIQVGVHGSKEVTKAASEKAWRTSIRRSKLAEELEAPGPTA